MTKEIDYEAVAKALGATSHEEVYTVLVFPNKYRITVKELNELDERTAMQKLTALALGYPPTVTR